MVSFASSAVFIAALIFLCRKKGWYDTVDERKIHKGNVPRLGGIGFVAGCVFSLLLHAWNGSFPAGRWLPLFVSGMMIFVFGVLDDFKNLSAPVKLLAQCSSAAIVIFSGYSFESVFGLALPFAAGRIATFLWIVGIVNAFNLIDGADGLCAGISILIFISYGLFFASCSPSCSSFCFILASAVLAFFLYNKPRALIFMGDGGSQFLGFVCSVLPLADAGADFSGKKFLASAVLVSVPAGDCIAAVWRRLREHRNCMSPDRLHLHHKLMRLGLTCGRMLLFLLAFQAALCVCVLHALAMEAHGCNRFLACALLAVTAFFCIIHFLDRKHHAESGQCGR